MASKSPSINIDLTNFTTPVRDQGKCNSCYAHSAIATVEALLYRKYNQIFDLSEQQILDCTRDWAPK
jgi:C1A family cysteine protease